MGTSLPRRPIFPHVLRRSNTSHEDSYKGNRTSPSSRHSSENFLVDPVPRTFGMTRLQSMGSGMACLRGSSRAHRFQQQLESRKYTLSLEGQATTGARLFRADPLVSEVDNPFTTLSPVLCFEGKRSGVTGNWETEIMRAKSFLFLALTTRMR
jgi:hypothetical protein